MEISRIGINVEDSILYIEYCSEENVRKVELTQELLSPNNVGKLVEYLKENKSELFIDNVEILESKLLKLLSSITEYKREKILKSGAASTDYAEKEIEAEENEMHKTFEKNVITSSHANYVYDKTVPIESQQNEEITNYEIPNEWDEEIDEDIVIMDDSANEVDNLFFDDIVDQFIDDDIDELTK